MNAKEFEAQHPWPLFEEEDHKRDIAWWRSHFTSSQERIEADALAAMSDELVYWAAWKLRSLKSGSSGAREHKSFLRSVGGGGSDWFDAKADDETSFISLHMFIESLAEIAKGELGAYQEGHDEFVNALRARYQDLRKELVDEPEA